MIIRLQDCHITKYPRHRVGDYQYADHFLRISIEQKEKQKDKSQISVETL